MKRIWFAAAAGVLACALFLSGSFLVGQAGKGPPKKGPGDKGPPGKGGLKDMGKGKGGFGFERPLAKEPRRGNPGASPDLSDADFRDLVKHAKDFDGNKDGKLSKAELPEMFASFFDRADADRDGFLDASEMKRLLEGGPATTPAAPPPAKAKAKKAP